jgi:hypothetical protein
VCPPYRLKAAAVELEEVAVTRQRLGKYVPAATKTQATIELLDEVFCMWSMEVKVKVKVKESCACV